MKSQHLIGALALMAAPLVGATQLGAATATANLSVTATVAASCTISVTSMSFGTLSATANTDATATITTNCTNGTSASITTDEGMNGNQNMDNGEGALIQYRVYRDSARTGMFGPLDTPILITGSGVNQTTTLYGRVTTNSVSNKPAGSYRDTLRLTITY